MKKYPFKFLDSYDREDTSIFFGRDEEISALYEMVFQASILLVYGASGTGKTSLIQCGLASRFQTHDWLALTIRRGSNINIAFENALVAAGGNSSEAEDMSWLDDLMEFDTEQVATTPKQLTPFAEKFKAIYLKSFRPLYLIFDQFEELFILGSKEEQQQFIATVKEILQLAQPVKMIFSIREEYLGHLNEFEKAVPELFRKKLRVEPMNLDKVRKVIVGATTHETSNVRVQAGETDAVAEAIFNKIKGKEKTLTIQLPYLQVFLDKYYLTITNDNNRQADALFDMHSLNKLGDIGDVLSTFLEEQAVSVTKTLSNRFPTISIAIVWNILSPFATLEGTKEPMEKANLYRLTGLEPTLIDQTIETFIDSRILRYTEETDQYEIAHDSLAKRIAEKRSDEQIAVLEIKRLIKSQTSLKADAREPFSEKQLTFIEPFLGKIQLSPEEEKLIAQSREAITKRRAEEQRARDEENKRLREKQHAQKRFIRWMVVASFVSILLAVFSVFSWLQAKKSSKKANKSAEIAEFALKKADSTARVAQENLYQNIRNQAVAKAKEYEAFGDSYKDIGKLDFAKQSYQEGLDVLAGYDKRFSTNLINKRDSCALLSEQLK